MSSKRSSIKTPTSKISKSTIDRIVKNARDRLNLNQGIWKDMDNTLVLLAFTHKSAAKSGIIPQDVFKKMQEYGAANYEKFEFVGDRVLEMIITNLMIGTLWPEATPRLLTEIKSELVKNSSLECYMMAKGLCDNYLGTRADKKTCADIFEAVIGVLYFYLTYRKGLGYESIDHIEQWLISNFQFPQRLRKVLLDQPAC